MSDATQQLHSFSARLESSSGMSRWLAWLGIMLTIVVLFGLAALSKNPTLVANGMYLTIGLLAIILIYKGYVDVRFLDQETQLASQQVGILETVDDLDSFFTQAQPSVFRSHIESLHTIAQSQPDVSQDNLITLLHTRLMSRNRMVELFASILITLGLVGTIIGLILMMDGLASAMAPSVEAGAGNLMEKIADPKTGPLSGLATAFYTTLLGAVLGGVVLRVLTNVVDTNVMTYTAHVAELTEVYVLPHIRKTARDLFAPQRSAT